MDLELGIILDAFCRQPAPWMNGKTGHLGISPSPEDLKPALSLCYKVGKEHRRHSSVIVAIK